MKTIPVITVLFTLLGCIQGAESPDWESEMAHKNSAKELRATPTITVQKTGQNTNSANVVLLVENRTGVDLEYNSRGDRLPQIFIKEKRDGRWVATSWDWCGTGMHSYVVKNQETATFELPACQSPIQIFTIFRNATAPKEFSFIKLYEKDGN